MMDDKTKQRQIELIDMLSNFCDEKLDDEYKDLSIKLVQKMSRKHNIPFKRGYLKNWASGIIYALGQINFLFDKSFEPYLTADDICDFFNTKKSTSSNKAREIRKMFNMGYYDDEFSTNYMLINEPIIYKDNASGFMLNEESFISSINNDLLEELMDKIKEYGDEIPIELDNKFIFTLMNSTLFCAPFFEGIILFETPFGNKFFPFFTSIEEFKKAFPDINKPLFFSFYDFCEIIANNSYEIQITGVKLNPDSHDFYFSKDMMKDLYNGFS